MFYIKIFYRILFKNILMGVLFVTATLCLFAMPELKNLMEKKIDKIVPEKTFNPHFLALLFDTDEVLIEKKFSRLPGIETVEFLKKEEIRGEIEKTARKLNLPDGGLLFDGKHAGVRVYFEEKTGRRAQELIRDYLTKLVGPSNITMGSIMRKEQGEKYLEILHEYRHGVVAATLGIVFLCWFFLFLKFRGIILEEAYLIERFQRRKLVGMKIYLSGILSMAIVMAILARFPLNPHIPWPLLLQMVCVFLLTRYKWERI